MVGGRSVAHRRQSEGVARRRSYHSSWSVDNDSGNAALLSPHRTRPNRKKNNTVIKTATTS